MKTWKLFEEVTGMLFDALSADPNVRIRTNVKLPDIRGNKRQFDVLIEHEISSIPVTIAIECKKHKGPIPVGHIEAFNSKCARSPEIHRKIFVSQDGYQSGAIAAAEDFIIELYTLEEVKKNTQVLCGLENYNFKIDKRLCIRHAIKISLYSKSDLIVQEDKGYNINFVASKMNQNLWDFPEEFVFNMSLTEWRGFLKNRLDGKYYKCPIRIIPNEPTNLLDENGDVIDQISVLDLVLKLSGELIQLNRSKSRQLKNIRKENLVTSTAEYSGSSSKGESTFLNFVDARNNRIKVFCTIADEGKVKYQKKVLWEVQPGFKNDSVPVVLKSDEQE